MDIKATIEYNKGCFFIFSDDIVCDCAFGGNGITVEAAKKDFELSIEEMKSITLENGGEWQNEEISVNYVYDISALFADWDTINISRFAQYAGINASKMRAYSSGTCKPSKSTKIKIESALHKLGESLAAIRLL